MRRGVVMADAGFEAVLGTVLVMGYVFGQIDTEDFADPVTGAVSALFGLVLIVFAVALGEVVKRDLVTDRFLVVLATGNAVFAALLAVWLVRGDGFTATGRAVVWVTVVALLVLAAIQAGLGALRTQPASTQRR